MSHDEYDPGEPVPGLPEALPDGEVMLWQGAPDTLTMARKAFHGTIVAVYFALLAGSAAISSLMDGEAPARALLASTPFLVTGCIAIGIVVLLGYIAHRTTLYTLTSKRLVMRFGMALPMTLNIPFTQIAAANAKVFANGTGDIAFKATDELPVTYVHLWPHARGFKLARPQPALRCVPDAKGVCELMTKAMLAHGITGEVRSLRPKQTETTTLTGHPGVPAAA